MIPGLYRRGTREGFLLFLSFGISVGSGEFSAAVPGIERRGRYKKAGQGRIYVPVRRKTAQIGYFNFAFVFSRNG